MRLLQVYISGGRRLHDINDDDCFKIIKHMVKEKKVRGSEKIR